MRASIIGGIEVPVEIKYGDGLTFDFYHLGRSGWNLMNTANFDKFSHHQAPAPKLSLSELGGWLLW